jgi:O-antigen ligase
LKQTRGSQKQAGLALGAAFAFLVVALINAASAAFGRSRWQWIAAIAFAAVALLWWLVAVRWMRAARDESRPL